MKSISRHSKDARRHLLEILVAFLLMIMIIMIAKLAVGQQSIEKQIKDITKTYVADTRNHALVVGIIDGNKQHFYYFGETEKGNGILPDSNSIFEIGTLTEVFTTSLLAKMQQEGLADLSDPVQKYFPEGVTIPVYKKFVCDPTKVNNSPMPEPRTLYYCYPDPTYHPRQIVLCDLATHTSGLPQYPSNANRVSKPNPFADYTDSELYHFINKYQMSHESGLEYSHSITGMAMLGKALSLGSNMSYEELLTQEILGPLHMDNTHITLNDAQQKLFLNGHKSNGKIIPHWDYNALAPGGGLRSNVTDMMAFLSANLSNSSPFAITHLPRISITEDYSLLGSQVALGWIVSLFSNTQMTWSESTEGGFACFIGMVESTGKGVVILSNSANEVDQLGRSILHVLNQPLTVPIIENIPTN